jgi:polyisoprenyl-teichoic acid--peptidoglycan teichoic acid transferase
VRARRTIRAGAATLAVLLAAVVAAAAGGPPGGTPRAEAAPLFQVGRAHGAEHLPALDGSRPIFVLVLGSDARPGETIARARADSIHLIGINPRRGAASVLGFPRDSWVPIPGFGSGKINSAMVYGGPELMVRTVEALTGIKIDYYLLTSFGGLRSMVDAVGGITVDVPYAMSDHFSGANFRPGRQRLSGKEALALSRNRKDTPNGDFSRSHNQGLLILSALGQFRREFREDPARVLVWIGGGLRNLRTDVPISELLDLAFTVSKIPVGKVHNRVVPGGTGFVGSSSVVFLSGSAGAIYSKLRGDGLL